VYNNVVPDKELTVCFQLRNIQPEENPNLAKSLKAKTMQPEARKVTKFIRHVDFVEPDARKFKYRLKKTTLGKVANG